MTVGPTGMISSLGCSREEMVRKRGNLGSGYVTDARDRRRDGVVWQPKGPNASGVAPGGPVTGIDPINSTDRSKNVNRGKMAIPSGENFATCYMELCKQQRIRPLPVICVTLPHSLDLTTDRVKMDDWGPILNSLSLDRSLKSVSVRSRYQCRKPLEEINSEDKARNMGVKHKEPVVLTRYLLEWLSHSVAQCLRNSRALTCLELEGVPFPADCLAALCVGLAGTPSLRHLSLRRCCIGDNGCELVCRTVADLRTLRSFDLSECDLAESCANGLAAALSRQKLSLYDETWKESLRYREPNLEAMPGLRRLTLNGNPRLGDRAISELIEAVRDSLWLKALDLQHCGLTDCCGEEIIRLLEHNTTLAIVDVRMNINLSDDMLQQIFRRLEANGANMTGNGKSPYMWMSLTRNYQRNTRSAGGIRRNRYEDIPTRTDNLYNGRPKTAIPYRRVSMPDANAALRYSVKTRGPSIIDSNKKNKNNNKNNHHINRLRQDEKKSTIAQQPKISLRLDLKSQIESATGTTMARVEQSNDKVIGSDIVATEDDVVDDNDDDDHDDDDHDDKDKNKDKDKRTQGEEEQEKRTKVNKILLELSEARIEQDGLIRETKKTDILLAEERIRRQAAESKLRTMKEKLWDLETELKNKERETRGFLLVSQRSLEDIATSFDRLLEMLEKTTPLPPSPPPPSAAAAAHGIQYTEDEYSVAKSEIRTRVAHLIKKSKSEGYGRLGFKIEREQSGVIEVSSRSNAPGEKKAARSEGDVTTGSTALPSIIQPIRLERNIGDTLDVVSSQNQATRPSLDYYKTERNKITDSCLPCERARAIFARIVNGDATLDLRGGHGS